MRGAWPLDREKGGGKTGGGGENGAQGQKIRHDCRHKMEGDTPSCVQNDNDDNNNSSNINNNKSTHSKCLNEQMENGFRAEDAGWIGKVDGGRPWT